MRMPWRPALAGVTAIVVGGAGLVRGAMPAHADAPHATVRPTAQERLVPSAGPAHVVVERRFVMRFRAVLVALAALLALAGCTSSGSHPSSTASASELLPGAGNVGPYDGFGLPTPFPRPAFTLTDTSGRPYDFGSRTAGRATMLFFGYTRCPDVCPATMADIGSAIRSLPITMQQKVTIVFVTTDVKHDSAPVIARYLRNFSPASHATWVGLRGTQAQIDAAQAAAHVFIASEGGKTHSSQVLLYGPDDYAHVSYAQSNNEEKSMAHDLRVVMKS
jgi:protein SCO1